MIALCTGCIVRLGRQDIPLDGHVKHCSRRTSWFYRLSSSTCIIKLSLGINHTGFYELDDPSITDQPVVHKSKFKLTYTRFSAFAFCAMTLLVGYEEEHLACEKL